MRFRSPWQSPLFVRLVAAVRWLLRPAPRLENRFIEALTAAQNSRVQRHLARRPASTILLIMPRCVSRRGCCNEARHDLAACRDCRDCPLGDIARLCDRFGVRALVAYRSHIAFAIARREKPDLIIASACHDRLIKALRSVPEYPALLAPLAGMEKMCVNADIDLVWFEEQLRAVTAAPPVTEGGGRLGDPVGAP